MTHTLIIPDNVEKIIRNLCALSPDREWSGVLFYYFEGNFDEGLTLTCKDILLLDQGSGTATEFDASNPEVARYMFSNGLMNCCIGLIHSHQSFSTFFSGTDTGTLLNEGKDCNNFLSLIVNNAGQYTAAITRKVLVSTDISERVVSRGEYSLFNTETKVHIPEETEENEYQDKEIRVEYFKLNIEKNSTILANPECTAFGGIIKRPQTKGYSTEVPQYTQKHTQQYGPYGWKPQEKKENPVGDYYGSLFKEYGIERADPLKGSTESDESEYAILDEQCRKINWNDKEYLLLLERMFFGSPFIKEPKYTDFKSEIRYVASFFDSGCTKAFSDTTDMEIWLISSIDYYLYDVDIPVYEKTKEYAECFDDTSVIAYHIANALSQYAETSDFIAAACHLLMSKI